MTRKVSRPKISDYDCYLVMKRCPRFDRCSAPVCPLDAKQDDKERLPDEPKCGLSKNRRLELAKGHDLPYGGLTKAEYAVKDRWSKLSESEKAVKVRQLEANRAKTVGNLDGTR